ncbi:hypothetical protein AXG89_41705 (plasmid) [Burkholderia sp. PAMC 26561]|nr:hypothetical protein AXG89_41705 [Burkholderia sp. PAMC 26561]
MDAPTRNGIDVPKWVLTSSTRTGASIMTVTTIGIDLAKNVFQVHGVDERGITALRKPLRKPCITRLWIFSSVSCSRPVAISIGKRKIGRHIRDDS